MKERQRIVTSGPCLITLSTPESHPQQFDGQVRDISHLGAKISLADQQRPCVIERLGFPVPECGAVFNVSASICWVSDSDGGMMLGCSFTERLPYMAWASLAARGKVDRRNESDELLPRVAAAWDGQAGSEARVRDFSPRGLSLFCAEPPPPGTLLSILLSEGSWLIRAKALWTRPNGQDGHLVGCSFLSPVDAERFIGGVEGSLLTHVIEAVSSDAPQSELLV